MKVVKISPKRLIRLLIDRQYKVNSIINNQYAVLDILGFGSYGTTYLCRDLNSDRKVVLKQMTKSKKQKMIHDMYNNEVDILGELDHPNIPGFFDSFSYQSHSIIVMEYIEGINLDDLLFENKMKFNEQGALIFVRDLAAIVSYIHSKGVIHGDIRIPNVIYHDNKITLIDFGLASKWSTTAEYTCHPANSDFYDMGDFLLFLLYSDFDSAVKKKKMWTEELSLRPQTVNLLKRLLEIEAPYVTIKDAITDINRAIEACKR